MARRKTTSTASRSTTSKPAPEARTTSTPDEQVTLVGGLCADPVLRHTKSGKPVTTIRIAVNARDSEPTFHSVVVWNRTAEVVCEYLRKGRRVEVLGRPQEHTYEAADGTERKVTEISAFRVVFLSSRTEAPAAEKELS
jgi:single-strand DNA-binding protein